MRRKGHLYVSLGWAPEGTRRNVGKETSRMDHATIYSREEKQYVK